MGTLGSYFLLKPKKAAPAPPFSGGWMPSSRQSPTPPGTDREAVSPATEGLWRSNPPNLHPQGSHCPGLQSPPPHEFLSPLPSPGGQRVQTTIPSPSGARDTEPPAPFSLRHRSPILQLLPQTRQSWLLGPLLPQDPGVLVLSSILSQDPGVPAHSCPLLRNPAAQPPLCPGPRNPGP